MQQNEFAESPTDTAAVVPDARFPDPQAAPASESDPADAADPLIFAHDCVRRLRRLLARDLERLERDAAQDFGAALSLELARHVRTLQQLTAFERKLPPPAADACGCADSSHALSESRSPAPEHPGALPESGSVPLIGASAAPAGDPVAALTDPQLMTLLVCEEFETARRVFKPLTRHLAANFYSRALAAGSVPVSGDANGLLRAACCLPFTALDRLLARDLPRRIDRLLAPASS